MLSKNHPIILFIDRGGFSLFQDTLTSIPKFNFTPDLVMNLDVVNKDQFSNLIATFIQINKIVPSSLAVILSDALIYSKDLVNTLQKTPIPIQPISSPVSLTDSEHKEEIQNFLDDIPFEEVLAKVIKKGEASRIVAVNKDLVMTIADGFVNKGSVLDAIIPSFLYGQNVNFTQGLTQNNIQAILGGSDIARIGNLLTNQQETSYIQSLENEPRNPPAEGSKKPQNLSLYILIGVFVTLLVILAIAYLNLGASQTLPAIKKVKSVAETVSAPTVPPVGGTTVSQAPITTIPIDIKSTKIKIVQSSQSDVVAGNLKTQLLGIGFQDITTETSGNSIPEKSSVLFSQNVPSDVRSIVIAEIKKILPTISVLENQDITFTITILVGKS